MEARGGIGRCYKEMFLACTEPARRRHYLTRSLDAYLAAYRENSSSHVARDQRCRPPGSRRTRRHRAPAGSAGGGRAGRADPADRRLPPVPDTWTEVTACEAAIALGRYDEAVERARGVHRDEAGRVHGRGVPSPAPERSGSSPPRAPRATSCSPCCARRCSGSTGARSRWSPPTSAPHASPSSTRTGWRGSSETTASCRLTWYRTGLQRCRAVARIQTADDVGVGTGFLVAGPDLHPDLPPLVLVTNGHVVPEDLDPTDARGGVPRPRRRPGPAVPLPGDPPMVVPALSTERTRHDHPGTGRLPAGRHPDPARRGAAAQAVASPAGIRHRPSTWHGPTPVLPAGQYPARLRPAGPALPITDRGGQLRQPGLRQPMAADRPAPLGRRPGCRT